MRLLRELLRILLWPALLAIWAVEDLFRRTTKEPTWQVGTVGAGCVFLPLATLGIFMTIGTDSPLARWAGAYILTSMELLALGLSYVVGFGRSDQVHALLQRFGERRTQSLQNTRTREGLCRVAVGFGYNVLYFGALYSLLYQSNAKSFHLPPDVASGSPEFDLFYYSASVVTLFTNPFAAVSVAAKALTIAEVLIGFCYAIFVFSSLVSFNVSVRQGGQDSSS